MKTLDVLIIGAPKTGKSNLVKVNLNKEPFNANPFETVGANVVINEYALPTGEVVRL